MSADDIKLPPLPKASKMYDIPGYDEEELKDYARAAVLADRASRAAQAEAAAGDAERYRLLRRKVCIAGGEFHILNLAPRYIGPDAAAELDAAIDAAMQRTSDGGAE